MLVPFLTLTISPITKLQSRVATAYLTLARGPEESPARCKVHIHRPHTELKSPDSFVNLISIISISWAIANMWYNLIKRGKCVQRLISEKEPKIEIQCDINNITRKQRVDFVL